MRSIVSFTCLLALLVYGPRTAAQAGGTVAFEHVNLIPMDRERIASDQTVIVSESRISEIGAAGAVRVPAGAVRIDGRGQFLMPSLAEMHAHISTEFTGPYAQGRFVTPEQSIERVLLLYVLNGIGTIRNATGEPVDLDLRERAARGELISPQIYTSGPPFAGASTQSVEAATKMVADEKAAGYNFIKVFPSNVTPTVFDAMAKAARAANIPIGGHIPTSIGINRALAAPYQAIDHLDGYLQAAARPGAPRATFWGESLADHIDEARLAILVTETKQAGTWQIPTESLLDAVFGPEDGAVLLKRPEMAYVRTALSAQWASSRERQRQASTPDQRRSFLEIRRRLIKMLHERGVGILLGSDSPQEWNVPGFSMHRELASLVAAGLTPYEALATGTRNVAEYLGTMNQTGTVTQGKAADLLLLSANPLLDIRNSSKVVGVMLRGRWFARSEIERKATS